MENKKTNRQHIFLIIMTFLRYFGDCFFYGYTFLFLEGRGFTPGEASKLFAIVPLISLFANPLWNIFIKDTNSNRKIMRIITILEGLSIILLTLCHNVIFFVLVISLLGFSSSPFYHLHDGFIEGFSKAYNKKYSSIRVFGTIGYILSSFIAAIMLPLISDNYDILFYISGGLFILTSFMLIIIKPIDLTLIKESKETSQADVKKVVKNRYYWIFVLVYFFVYSVGWACDRFHNSFFVHDQGLTPSNWAFIFTGILICETIVLILYPKLHMKPSVAWTVGGALYFLRYFLFGLNLPLYITIPLSMLRGVSFGLLTASFMDIMESICGYQNVTGGYLIASIGSSVVQTIFYFFLGDIIDVTGYQSFFLATSALVFIGVLINLISQVKHKFSYEYVRSDSSV